MIIRHRIPLLLFTTILFSVGTAAAFSVSGLHFNDYHPSSTLSTGRSSGGDLSFGGPAPSGPTPEELQREKERQERERRLAAAEEAHRTAVECVKRGDFGNAILQFRLALENDPGNQGVEQNLANAEKLRKDQPAARRVFNERALDDMRDEVRRLMAGGGPGAAGGPVAEGSSGDPMVVDLRFMGDKPLIVDPRKLKGGRKVPPQPMLDAVADLTDAEKARLSVFLQTRREPDTRLHNQPLINPLREPERYQKWLEEQKAQAKDSIPAALTGRLLEKLKEERYRKELDKALAGFVEAENSASMVGFYQAHLGMQDELVKLRKRFGMKDYSDVYKQDRQGRNRAEVDRLILKDVAEQAEKAQEDPEFRRALREASDRVQGDMVREREKSHRQAVEKLLKSLTRLEKP